MAGDADRAARRFDRAASRGLGRSAGARTPPLRVHAVPRRELGLPFLLFSRCWRATRGCACVAGGRGVVGMRAWGGAAA